MKAVALAALGSMAVLVALAGCASAPPAAEPPAYTFVQRGGIPPMQEPDPCQSFGGSTVLVGVGTAPGAQPHRGVAPLDAVAHLVVPANTTALVLDMWWDQGATAGMRSYVEGPSTVQMSEPRQDASADDPLRIRIDAPEPGAWTWRALADPAAVGVVVHFQEGLYSGFTPEQAEFGCNAAGA